MVQAPQHSSNIHSDTSVHKVISPPGCYLLKGKRYKTLQNSLAKAPKIQRELKYIDRNAGVAIETKNKHVEIKLKWKVGEVQVVLPLQTIFISMNSDPWIKMAELTGDPDGSGDLLDTTGYHDDLLDTVLPLESEQEVVTNQEQL